MPGIGFKGSRVLRNQEQASVQVETISYPVSEYRVRKLQQTGRRSSEIDVLEHPGGEDRISVDPRVSAHLIEAIRTGAISVDVVIQIRYPAGVTPVERSRRTTRRIQLREDTNAEH